MTPTVSLGTMPELLYTIAWLYLELKGVIGQIGNEKG